MNKTKIEWCDYTINPVKGLCPMACSYCYARKMYKRFKRDTEITYHPEVFEGLDKYPDGSKIFVGSTIELFGEWVRRAWINDIFCACNRYPQHTFIFLTKQPQHLKRWSPFLDNCWAGVSLTNNYTFIGEMSCIFAPVKFISFEPLLNWGDYPEQNKQLSNILANRLGIDWVIIGQQTPVNRKTMPKLEWIIEIIQACDTAGIPVFLKDNIALNANYPFDNETSVSDFISIAYKDGKLRQEFPRMVGGK